MYIYSEIFIGQRDGRSTGLAVCAFQTKIKNLPPIRIDIPRSPHKTCFWTQRRPSSRAQQREVRDERIWCTQTPHAPGDEVAPAPACTSGEIAVVRVGVTLDDKVDYVDGLSRVCCVFRNEPDVTGTCCRWGAG